MKNKITYIIGAILFLLIVFSAYRAFKNIDIYQKAVAASTKMYVDSLERKVSELSVEIDNLKKIEKTMRDEIEKNKNSVISAHNKYKYLQNQLNNTPIEIDITEEDSLILKRLQNILE